MRFNDGTIFTTNYYAPDWFNNNSGALYTVALQGFERIDLNSGSVSGNPGNPRFYQTVLALTSVPGATNKRISSIHFAKPSANSTGIFAVSGLSNAFQTSLTFSLATLTNLPATAVQTKAATLNGQVLSTGNDAPNVTLYYGLVDGGTNPGAWANSVAIGWQTRRFFSGGFQSGFQHDLLFHHQGGECLGHELGDGFPKLFHPGSGPPTLANLPASAILANSAAINGQVLTTGGDTPTVTFYYGPANGGASAAAWSNSIPVGLQTGFLRGGFSD